METIDLEQQPTLATELCVAPGERLLSAVTALGQDDLETPSHLPGWT